LVFAIAWLVPLMTSAPAADHSTQQPTFRVAIDMVTLDVIPRGENGRFVPNLVADDFQVLEDAVPQKVASLVLVNGGRVFNLTLPASPAAASPDGLVLPASRATTDAGGRVFVLIVDDLHFTATETPVVRALLRKVIARLFHDGDMVAMFSTGSSSIEIPSRTIVSSSKVPSARCRGTACRIGTSWTRAMDRRVRKGFATRRMWPSRRPMNSSIISSGCATGARR
jgi:hypothetical protein